MDGRYPSDFPNIWEHPRGKGQIKELCKRLSQDGHSSFKKELEISSMPCPCDALPLAHCLSNLFRLYGV